MRSSSYLQGYGFHRIGIRGKTVRRVGTAGESQWPDLPGPCSGISWSRAAGRVERLVARVRWLRAARHSMHRRKIIRKATGTSVVRIEIGLAQGLGLYAAGGLPPKAMASDTRVTASAPRRLVVRPAKVASAACSRRCAVSGKPGWRGSPAPRCGGPGAARLARRWRLARRLRLAASRHRGYRQAYRCALPTTWPGTAWPWLVQFLDIPDVVAVLSARHRWPCGLPSAASGVPPPVALRLRSIMRSSQMPSRTGNAGGDRHADVAGAGDVVHVAHGQVAGRQHGGHPQGGGQGRWPPGSWWRSSFRVQRRLRCPGMVLRIGPMKRPA